MAATDFVIAGAGHNSLVTACYLAKAGYSCVVLDARPIPGGGCATEYILGTGIRDRHLLDRTHVDSAESAYPAR